MKSSRRLSQDLFYFIKLLFLANLTLLVSARCSTPPGASSSSSSLSTASGSSASVTSSLPAPTKSGNLPTADSRIVLLYVSDLHGRLRANGDSKGGYARLAQLIKKEKASASAQTDVLAIAGGDILGKSALPCRKTQEKGCISLMSQMGFDLAVLGNGELKRSASELNELLKLSGVRWISSNVSSQGGAPAWTPSWGFDGPKSGLKLFFASWTVAPSEGEIDLRKAKLQIRKETTDKDWQTWAKASAGRAVVWLPHQSLEEDQKFLTKACTQSGLQNLVLLKSNDHQQRSLTDLCAPIFEPGAYGQYLSRVVLRPSESGSLQVESHNFIEVGASVEEDAQVKFAIDELYKTHAPTADEVVAQVESDVSPEAFAKWVGKSFRKVTRADVAIVNMGAIKDSIKAGALTRESLLMTYPYTDEIMGLDWPARDFEKSLCEASRRQRDPFEDYGSELVLEGLELKNPGTPECKIEGPRRASYKVSMVSYLVKRSKKWLGKDVQPTAFKFQVNTEEAFNKMLKDSGKKL